ncbi:MAG: DNA-directed RNA polymerase subunit alpha [Dehalococcoidales bacterium]|nr:MAG: DNA-directed RNA polymerase subunit alpha [Dehalococcoidales bacterium]
MSLSAIAKIECVETRDNYGRFVAEPLDKGFGMTMGNALRRVMLGHLPGAAITRVRIEGIQHEFSSIPHVREDVIEFLLNVKAIRLKPIAERPGRLILDMAGEGRVCAADINPSSDFEIANPELYLATMDSPEARLFVEFDVEIGVGYMEAESGDSMPLGVIPVDAIFTPVRKVNYTIEPLHVGRETSHERLYLEIWTDGTIEAGEAMSQSASILMTMLNSFVNYGTVVPDEVEKEFAELAMSEEQYNMPVEQLALSVRTMNCLRRGNITTVGELISRGEKGLLALRNFGQKSRQEIEERLNEFGLSLIPKTEEAEEPAEVEADDLVASAAEAATVPGAEGEAGEDEGRNDE